MERRLSSGPPSTQSLWMPTQCPTVALSRKRTMKAHHPCPLVLLIQGAPLLQPKNRARVRPHRAGKIIFFPVATLEPSLDYLVAKVDNFVAKNTIDNILVIIAGRILGRQIGHQRLKVSRHRLTNCCQMRLGDQIFPALLWTKDILYHLRSIRQQQIQLSVS